MKKSFLVKCIAIILFAVTMTTLLLSGIAFCFGIYTGAFTETLKEQHENKELITANMLWNYEHRINESLEFYVKYNDYKEDFYLYSYLPEGILVEVKDVKDDSILYSTYDKSAGDITVSYERSFSVLKDEYKNEEDIIKETYEEESTTVHVDDNDNVVDEGETVPSTSKYYDEYTYEITIQYNENSETNYIGITRKAFDIIADNKTNIIITAVLSFIISLVALIIIMRTAGHTEKSDNIYISKFDKFPVDILIVIFGALNVLLACGFVAFIDWLDYGYQEFNFNVILISLLCLFVFAVFVDFVLLAILIMTTSVRCKTSTFIKSTIIYKLIVLIIKVLKFLWKGFVKGIKAFVKLLHKIPMVWKAVVFAVIIMIFECFIFVLSVDWGYWWPVTFLFNCILCVGVILVSILLKDIKNTTEEISKGNVYKKIDTKYLFLDLKDHAENINNMSDGIQKAVAEQMKSERFKTELITNVSHDIKTPLTSIINYVDLLEKEEIDNETAKEYVDVLSRQSSRLKKLIDDLLEASKASTGNINVNLMKFELGILLSQALGEYEERFEKNNLQVILNKTDEMLFVMADNRHMWRVFDNVLNNIAKYAQSGTRVYVDAKRNGQFAEISFRNISKEPLNISGDELMERFVRGDSSRNTEGSGLGLSIAKSLTEVQKGNLEIKIDGDLFKVIFNFPLSE